MEIIVTLTILAVLAAIIIPSMTGWIDKAQVKACMAELGGIRRSYQAEAAAEGYVVDNSTPLLADAVREWGGEMNAQIGSSFTCPCGHPGSASFNADETAITDITCDEHGSLNGGGVVKSVDLPKGFSEIWETKVYQNKTIPYYFLTRGAGESLDSAGGNWAPGVIQNLKDAGYDMDSVKTWRICKTTAKNVIPSEYILTWTSGDIQSLNVGTLVPASQVTVTQNGSALSFGEVQTGTVAVSSKPMDGTTKKILGDTLQPDTP